VLKCRHKAHYSTIHFLLELNERFKAIRKLLFVFKRNFPLTDSELRPSRQTHSHVEASLAESFFDLVELSRVFLANLVNSDAFYYSCSVFSPTTRRI